MMLGIDDEWLCECSTKVYTTLCLQLVIPNQQYYSGLSYPFTYGGGEVEVKVTRGLVGIEVEAITHCTAVVAIASGTDIGYFISAGY